MLPISTKLDSPELIGTDRLLAVLAVRELFPYARPAIVIDSGTAVTVDVLDAQGEFAGGDDCAVLGTYRPSLKMLARRSYLKLIRMDNILRQRSA